MAKSGVYRNCLPQLPKRATGIAMAKSTRPLKLVTSPPLKRIAQCPDNEMQARNAKRLRLLQEAERFNNSGMMYSIYTPGPQYLQNEPQPAHYNRHPAMINATPNIQGNGVFCCLKMGNHAFAQGKENGCECPNKLKRKFKGRDLKRRSPVNKSKGRRGTKDRNRPPLSYNNFLNTLEQAKKASRMAPTPIPAPVKVGYNNGFIPLMTSTPTQTMRKTVFFPSHLPPHPTEFSAKSAEIGTKSTLNSQETKETRLYSKEDANTTEEIVAELVDFDGSFGNLSNKAIVDILEKLPDVKKNVMRKGGKVAPGKVMLPPPQTESDKSSQCSNDDNNNKKQKKTRSKLPGMYPLGAPQAASSPIHSSKKREIAFGASVKKFDFGSDKMVHRPLANITNQRNCTPVWRPW